MLQLTKASLAEFPALNGQSTLQAGDMFVFPRGLVHYHLNCDAKNSAIAISAFGSANAGINSVPTTVFNTGIDDGILAKSFKLSRPGLHPKPNIDR
ncbi:germin-like protein 9-3 [Quercus suber]|uniref:Germin-like protein n=1 Tax=Quercus suber TaxID=58331 RepID=A0AAW0J774_QUESU